MVNKAIEEMVVLHHGEAVWEKIKAKAGVDAEVFMTNESCPDDITNNLVGTASDVIEVPAQQILVGFGEHWGLHAAQERYVSLVSAAGKSRPGFLQNLPDFHSRVSIIFPVLQPPLFQCTDFTDRSLKLQNGSHLPGLAPFGLGLMRGLGRMLRTEVTVHPAEPKAGGADHDVFEVTWQAALAA